MLKEILVHGCETWSMAEMDIKRLDTWHKEILRRIQGPVVQQGIWRKRINTLRTESFKLFKRSFPGFLTILTF
jgi:hypothetical protein